MRDVNRLDGFYEKLKEIHKENFPDWRFGQMMYNFFNYSFEVVKRDPFFYEEDHFIERFNEYVKWIKRDLV